MSRVFPITIALILVATEGLAQGPSPGNTLITPLRSTQTFLIDISMTTLQSWNGTNGAGHTVYLLPDNSVIRCQGDPNGQIAGGGGSGGHLQRIDEDDNIIWDYFFSDAEKQQHHDIEPMPNGNVLVIAWVIVTQAEAIAAGRTAATGDRFLPTLIAELQPVGSNDANIVWEWRIWDHIVQDSDTLKPNFGIIADHPELVDVNLGNGNGSWAHVNFIDYDEKRDEIVFSARRLEEVLVIDHSTTTAEAAGHTGGNRGKGGDILYRWGNPQNYGRGTEADRVFFGVHGGNRVDPLLPGAGNIIAFNNGNRAGDLADSSSVVEIVPPIDSNGDYVIAPGQPFGPAAPVWKYETGLNFFSLRFGSGFRMPNGNTLICEGTKGNIFEVNPDGTKVWVYIEPIGNGVFAAQRYFDTTVPTLLSRYDVTADRDRVRIVWELSDYDEGVEFTVERAEAGARYFTSLIGATVERDGKTFTFVDTEFERGKTHVYRIQASDGRQRWLLFETEPVTTQRWALALEPAYPNPFNPSTTLPFTLSEAGNISLRIYDVAGRLVRTVYDGYADAGTHEARWDGRADDGTVAATGVYFMQLRATGATLQQKLIIMK
ncbi:MAG: aryl-sulfate sulfotransferase [bacterium]|nr:aryl-sulfate sulfotransferase [bacterium]